MEESAVYLVECAACRRCKSGLELSTPTLRDCCWAHTMPMMSPLAYCRFRTSKANNLGFVGDYLNTY